MMINTKKKHENEIAFYDLLRNIRENPFQYLRRPALKYLICYLDGYVSCSAWDGYINDKPPATDHHGDFLEFVRKKHSQKIHTHQHLSKIIEFYSPSEEIAFYNFFELFDGYMKCRKNRTGEILNISEDPSAQDIKNLSADGLFYKMIKNVHIATLLPSKSLRYVKHFIDGYTNCANALGLPISSYPKFEAYVRENLDKTSPNSIYDIIEFYQCTEEQAFHYFFKLLNNFLTGEIGECTMQAN